MSLAVQRPLRAAIIGCGAIAYEHLPFLAQSPRTELVATCDRSPALAEVAADRFGAGRSYTDAADMLADARPEVVHVLTPPHTHAGLVRDCLGAGAHVICEKPMTGSAAETAELLALAEQHGLMLIESRNLLFNDPVIMLHRHIANGRLGEVIECDVLLSLDFLAGPLGDRNLAGPSVALRGGAVHDFLPHLAYLFLDLTGSGDIAAASVHGTLANRSRNPRAGFDLLDALIVTPTHRGRIRIAADVGPEMFRVILRGTRATIETDLYNPFLRYDGPPNTGKRASLGQVANGLGLIRDGWRNLHNKLTQHGTYHGLPRMLDATYRAIQHGEPAPFSRTAIIETARLVDRLLDLGTTP